MEQRNGWPTILEENWKMQQDTHSSMERVSSESPIEHLAHVASYSTRPLLEALLAANTKRSRITSITAKSCGIAFLAGSPNILPMLTSPMRYIKVLDFQADLVTQDAFELKDGELVLLPRERCRDALHKSISYGLLGRFLSTAQDLEVLIINLRCHEMMSPVVEASDLVDVLGSHTWYNLQHLSIGGIWASQSQLLDFLGRHRDTLRSLSIHDVVLKEGCWQTCFGEMRTLLADTQLCSQSIHLGGVLYKQDSDDQGFCWDLSGTDSQGRKIGEIWVEAFFSEMKPSFMPEIELAKLSIQSST